MKANIKARNDERAIVNVVSMIMIVAIVVPILSLVLITFMDMTMRQIDMMNTTSKILDDALIRITESMGYDLHTGHGTIHKANYSKYTVDEGRVNYTCYLIFHEHELDNNFSAYYPVEKLPEEFEYDNISVKFEVYEIETYFNFVFPDVYIVYDSNGNPVEITDTPLILSQQGWTIRKIDVVMVKVIDIEKRV